MVTRKHIEEAKEYIKKEFKCKWCRNNYFDDEEMFDKHNLYMHGAVSDKQHLDAPDSRVHKIYMNGYYEERKAI